MSFKVANLEPSEVLVIRFVFMVLQLKTFVATFNEDTDPERFKFCDISSSTFLQYKLVVLTLLNSGKKIRCEELNFDWTSRDF